MKTIKLTKGKVAIIDDEDYKNVSLFKWRFSSKGRPTTWIKTNGIRRSISLHQMLLDAPKGKEVDHINGNPLDNRKGNLRICTHSENLMNQSIQKGREFKGVCLDKRNNKWRAYIKFNQKDKHLGSFQSKTLAAVAYNCAALLYFKEFARLNTFQNICNKV